VKVFIDTTFFYALYNKNDTFHKDAKEKFAHVIMSEYELWTNNLILIETTSLIFYRQGFQKLKIFIDWYKEFLMTQWFLEEDFWNIFKEDFSDKLSIVDRSLMISARNNDSPILTFDEIMAKEFGYVL